MGAESKQRGLAIMCLLALAVGCVAGVGAWFFRCLIGFFHNLLFLGNFSFYYDANLHTPDNPWGAGVIFVPVIGALGVAWMIARFAPEAKGHGVPEVMDAIYYAGGKIRPVVAVIKSLASALCIGSGGSVGREGPIIQIGSSFGSTIAGLVRLPPHQRVILIAAGAGGGIAATFNAPLGGVAFAIELLLVSVTAEAVLLVAIATTTASYIGRALLGTAPSFDFSSLQIADFTLESPWIVALFIPFGLVMGLVAYAFTKGIYWSEDRFDSMPGNNYTRHLSAMFVVGIFIYLFRRYTGNYYVEGVGYATIMDILRESLTDPLFLSLLFLVKYVCTCLTLGSGGSGGVFSPALFMGATVGSIFAHSLNAIFPGLHVDPAMFVIAGMAAAIGGSTGAVLTGAIMLMEMTADYNVVLPVIIATSFAYGVRKSLSHGSIYTLKLLRRNHPVPEGLQAAILAARRAKHLANADFRTATDTQKSAGGKRPLVIVEDGQIVGVVEPARTVSACIVVDENTSLIDTMRKMNAAQVEHVVVTTKRKNNGKSDRKADARTRLADNNAILGIITPRGMAAMLRENAEIL